VCPTALCTGGTAASLLPPPSCVRAAAADDWGVARRPKVTKKRALSTVSFVSDEDEDEDEEEDEDSGESQAKVTPAMPPPRPPSLQVPPCRSITRSSTAD
jgi:hypothetical protein